VNFQQDKVSRKIKRCVSSDRLQFIPRSFRKNVFFLKSTDSLSVYFIGLKHRIGWTLVRHNIMETTAEPIDRLNIGLALFIAILTAIALSVSWMTFAAGSGRKNFARMSVAYLASYLVAGRQRLFFALLLSLIFKGGGALWDYSSFVEPHAHDWKFALNGNTKTLCPVYKTKRWKINVFIYILLFKNLLHIFLMLH